MVFVMAVISLALAVVNLFPFLPARREPHLQAVVEKIRRKPVSYSAWSDALNYPERADVPVKPLDLADLGQLTFEPPDEHTFPCLRLAREAAAAGGTAPCVLNAANEVAVQAFLDEEIGFTAIAEVIERALDMHEPGPVRHFSDLYRADAEARTARAT